MAVIIAKYQDWLCDIIYKKGASTSLSYLDPEISTTVILVGH
jgi:hypothetical protein